MAKLPYAAAARQFAEQVVAGDVPACHWVKLACQRKFNYLARLRSKATPFRFNPKLTDRDGRSLYPADTLCTCIDRLRDAKGPLADEPIESSTQVDSKLFNFPIQLFAAPEAQHAHFKRESNRGPLPPPNKIATPTGGVFVWCSPVRGWNPRDAGRDRGFGEHARRRPSGFALASAKTGKFPQPKTMPLHGRDGFVAHLAINARQHWPPIQA